MMRIRRDQLPPPLTITGDLGLLSDEAGARFHLADLEGVSVLQAPGRGVCAHEHLFVVTSAPGNAQLRAEVRTQLAGRAGVIFLLGVPGTEEVDKELVKENEVFGDILQGDFPDSYPHLSHKVIMSFIWVNK